MIEDAKKWAEYVSKIPKNIERLRKIVHELTSSKDGIKAIDYSKEQVQVSMQNGDDVICSNAFRYDEKIAECESRIESMKYERGEFIACCIDIESPYGDLLISRYINNKEWSTVGKDIGYTEHHTRVHLNDVALNMLDDCMPNEYRRA